MALSVLSIELLLAKSRVNGGVKTVTIAIFQMLLTSPRPAKNVATHFFSLQNQNTISRGYDFEIKMKIQLEKNMRNKSVHSKNDAPKSE